MYLLSRWIDERTVTQMFNGLTLIAMVAIIACLFYIASRITDERN